MVSYNLYVLKLLDALDLPITISFCSGWIADGFTINATTAGGSNRGSPSFELFSGEKIILIEGSRSGFENRTVVGRLKMTTSAGRTFGNVFSVALKKNYF